MSTEPEFTTAFEPHPLEGSSRFSLLGLLAGLYKLVDTFAFEPLTAEQRRLAIGVDPARKDDRELANTILGERVVDVMFGKTDPVRVTVSGERRRNTRSQEPND